MKRKPDGCMDFCCQCCGTADTYDMTFTDKGAVMAPEQKAMMIGEMVHLDFMFFENDRFPVECEKQEDRCCIYILCCLCYCYGCLLPVKCCCCIDEEMLKKAF